MTKIRVALRVRPLSERERTGGFPVVVAVEENSAFITDIRVPERPKADSRARYREFNFDHAFWVEEDASEGAAQSEIYREMGPPLEKSILQGYNSCVLAYGQSGTGKTHTMLGTKNEPGLIPRLCHSIWDKLKLKEDTECLLLQEPNNSSGNKMPSGFRMEVSFMEIYREKVRDLLSPQSELKLREHPQYGPHVQNLSRVEVTGEMGLLDLLWEGECRRAIGQTGSNTRSSRSHAIWTIYLTRPPTLASSSPNKDKNTLITNRVHLVDLAGSEKAGFATAKNLLAEGADINRSLVALGNVISSLAEKASYIPYRDSALTWLLKDSLGGNATTAIIITASPASCCHAQTLNSFRFAQRARLVENSPRINVTSISALGPGQRPSPALYSIMSAFEIKKDISKLSRIIRTAQSNGGLLRGLAPRASWTRLVNALEGWNQIESEQMKLQREASEDATASNAATSIKSDVMVQADLRPSSEDPCSSAFSSKKNSPTRIIIGTEVFIPSSTSIKCLTWEQEQVQPVPKLPSTDEDEEYSSFKMTPPPTPPSSSKNVQIHHLKYLLPVQFPVTHHLDHAARISEKIHGSFSGEGPSPQKIQPLEVPDPLCEGDSSLIRERIPTLVNPKEITPALKTCSEVSFAESTRASVPVRCKSVQNFIEELLPVSYTEFATPKSAPTHILESIDHDLVTEEEIKGSKVSQPPSKYRMVNSKTPKKHNLTLKIPPIPPVFNSPQKPPSQVLVNVTSDLIPPEEVQESGEVIESPSKYRVVTSGAPQVDDFKLPLSPEETFYFTSESILSTPSSSRSSSAQSLHSPSQRPALVKVMPEESEETDYLDEILNDLDLDDYNNHPQMVRTVEVDLDLVEDAEGSVVEEAFEQVELVDLPHQISKPAIDGATNSKFRNVFAKELYQLEKFGKEVKQLLQKTQRCSVVEPFLEQILSLDEKDHFLPDDALDAEIDSCCGWSVEVELDKVQKEFASLNKILKTGIAPLGSSQGRRDSVSSSRSNSTTTTASMSTVPSTASLSSPVHQNGSVLRRNVPKVGQHFYPRRTSSSEFLLSARPSHAEPFVNQRGVQSAYHHQQQISPPFGHPGPYHEERFFQPAARDLVSYPHWNGYSNPALQPPNYGNSQPFVPSRNYPEPYGMISPEDNNAYPPQHPTNAYVAPSWHELPSRSMSYSMSSASNNMEAYHYNNQGYHPTPSIREVNALDEISTCSSYPNLQMFHSPPYASSRNPSSVNVNGQGSPTRVLFGGQSSTGNNQGSMDFCSCNNSMSALPLTRSATYHHNHQGHAAPFDLQRSQSYQNTPPPPASPSSYNSASHFYSSGGPSSTISSNEPNASSPSRRFQTPRNIHYTPNHSSTNLRNNRHF